MEENEMVEGQGVAEHENVGEVLERVGDDKEAAQEALDAEEQKDKPRTTLVAALEKLVYDPSEGTVPAVLEAVGGDVELATAVLEIELAKDQPRSTLVEPLELMLKGAQGEDAVEEEVAEVAEVAEVPEGAPAQPAMTMTDDVQQQMVASIEMGRENRNATIARNREIRRQQQIAIARTNRPDNESKTQAELEDG